MRFACLILLLSVTVLVTAYDNEDPWGGEEEPTEEVFAEESLDEAPANLNEKPPANRETQAKGTSKVKRMCNHEYYDSAQLPKVQLHAEHVRVPRQVHAYEVHENTEESAAPASPPYEEMLAASAEHYHKVYAAPGAPLPAYYINAAVSPGNAYAIRQVPSANVYVPVGPITAVPHGFVPSNNKDKYVVGQKPVNLVNVGAPVLGNGPKNAEALVNGPVPVSPEPAAPHLQQLAGEDQFGAAGHLHKHQAHAHARTHAKGGGVAQNGQQYHKKGGKTIKGFKEHEHLDKGAKGYKTDEKHRKEYEEAAGKKNAHRDHADHKGSHVEEAHGLKGAHFDEKKGHKKGHKTKGYHNKYHKDEFHKEHKFYDDYHKSGEHHRFGKFNAKHASNESGKKKAHHVNAGHDFVERGKKGYSNKGHLDSDHKGYNGKHGHEQHSEHHSSHGKKGAKAGGKEWGYAKKN